MEGRIDPPSSARLLSTDSLRARGVPEEFLTIANDRMAALNDAFAVIEKARAAA